MKTGFQPVDLVEKKLIQKYGSVEKSNETPVAYLVNLVMKFQNLHLQK